jgi:predicted DNA-binding WGR domain protein
MLAERHILLHAVDPERNVFRSWRCEIDRDLFGGVALSVTFGRTGSKGQTIPRPVTDEQAANRAVRRMLARRATAERRIGVAYRVAERRDFAALGG